MDPLVNRIFDASSSQELTEDELYSRLLDAEVIYLGEKHDHPDQHRLQAKILRNLVDAGRSPAVGLEVVGVFDTSLLMTYVAGARSHSGATDPATANNRLASQLGWGSTDSDQWRSYGEVLQVARENELILFGADLPTALRGRITMVGRDGLSAVERRQLPVSDFDDDNFRRFMFEQFREAHCGWGSPKYLGNLYDSWLVRNESMSRAVVDTLDEQEGEPVVLITGTGHVAFNMGIYERVEALRPGTRQLNLGLIELAAEPRVIGDYLTPLEFEGRNYGPQHEYTWFTRAMGRDWEDLCKEFTSRKPHGGEHGASQSDSEKQIEER
jgi:uncharacterized iron-regulated protein